MLKNFLIFILLALFICFSKSYAENNLSDSFKKSFNPQKYASSASIYDAQERKILLSNFWKATCRTCLIELPSLNRLAEKYPEIVVLAASQGEEDSQFIDRILHQERRLNNLSVFLDKKQKLMNLFGGGKVPKTYLIDKDGFIRGVINGGADFDSLKIHHQIEELI